MPTALNQIKTIVLLMMENRSFDHMLGHLTLDTPALTLEGLRQDKMADYSNEHNGNYYPLYEMPNDTNLETDLPHEADFVAQQMAKDSVSEEYAMDGFVDAYARANPGIPINTECIPMAYFPAKLVPITDFMARNFCICDHWYSPIPTSTQPNRTMAFSGYTPIYQTKTQLIPLAEGHIFQWMTDNNVKWRVYHDGFPFFALYDSLWPLILSDKFKKYEYLHSDWLKAPDPANDPEVIIIEPCYEDAPHFGGKQPNDNHAPLAVGWGEDFLRRTYQALTSNPTRWANTLFVTYYDEHGGFFDHVQPLNIKDATIGANPYPFASTGPRIPGLLLSPFVIPGSAANPSTIPPSSSSWPKNLLPTPRIRRPSTLANKPASGVSPSLCDQHQAFRHHHRRPPPPSRCRPNSVRSSTPPRPATCKNPLPMPPSNSCSPILKKSQSNSQNYTPGKMWRSGSDRA